MRKEVTDWLEQAKLPKRFLASARELTPVYMLARDPDVAGGGIYTMAKKTPPKIKTFLGDVKKITKPKKIILFGSRARGDFLEDSDYDILIVSEYFEGMHYHDRIVGMLSLMKKSLPIDLICMTPKEFNKKKRELSIVREADKEGKVLFTAK